MAEINKKYYVVEKSKGIQIKKIDEDDYQAVREVLNKCDSLAGVYLSHANYIEANKHFKKFKSQIEACGAPHNFEDLDDIILLSSYPITGLIIFTITYLNNLSAYAKTLKLQSLTDKVKKINRMECFQMLRALRNYAIHTSIPIRRGSWAKDTLKNKETYIFYALKNDIYDGVNNRNQETLKLHNSEKIIFEQLFEDAEKEINDFIGTITNEFVRLMTEKEKQSLRNNLGTYKNINGDTFFLNGIIKIEFKDAEDHNEDEVTEMIRFDSFILKHLIKAINSIEV